MDTNYFAHGGKELVIGGKLTFLPGATVEGLSDLIDIPPEQELELVCERPCVPLSKASTVYALREDFNRLLQALYSAGVLAQEEEAEHDSNG